MNLMKAFSWVILVTFLGSVASASYIVQNGTITTAKLANGAVTQAKRAALGQVVSSSSGGSATNATGSNVTVVSLSITTTGRPVMLQFQHDGSGNIPSFGCSSSNYTCLANFGIYRDGSLIDFYQAISSSGSGSGSVLQIPDMTFIDTGASAASHTYTVKFLVPVVGSSNTANATYMVLAAYEL